MNDIVEDMLKFKGFWKASLKDKAKWLIVWVCLVFFLSLDIILMLITAPIQTIKWLFRK